RRFGIGISDDARASFGLSTERDFLVAGPRMDDGGWHMLLGTYENGALSVYVDGQMEGRKNVQPPQTDGKGSWWMAQYPVDHALFRGTLDDVRVYARA